MPPTLSTTLFIAALSLAAIAMLWTFGGAIVRDAKKVGLQVQSTVSAREVSRYLMERGYIVCTLTPVKNTNKWLAFMISNGQYVVATVFTNGKDIQGHQNSLA